eukprot:COSAG01_NODE_2928_length_6838_cov_168.682149_6_plen_106_part_00
MPAYLAWRRHLRLLLGLLPPPYRFCSSALTASFRIPAAAFIAIFFVTSWKPELPTSEMSDSRVLSSSLRRIPPLMPSLSRPIFCLITVALWASVRSTAWSSDVLN